MQSIFISPPHIESPRWLQAFPSAQLAHDNNLPSDLQGCLIWLMLGQTYGLPDIERWVAAGARVVGMTQAEDPRQAKEILEAGASGYLHYLAVVPVLQQVSQVVEVGGMWLGVDLMRQLVRATSTLIKSPPSTLELNVLTAREQSVAMAVASGKSNKEVARELDIAERTVKAHLSAVFEKLGARDRLHLALILAGHR
ncbi:response regulator transcription factor [Cellvibrio sp.]|uniref:response regulator transcription factor n=1 Tax=Cellvibrio sp. TaxID=1965322 RepID=UPI003964885F